MISRFSIPRLTTSLYPADLMAVMIAASLPWSTSLPAIFVGLWLLALIPVIDRDAFLELLRRPVCFWPIAFFLLALIGTLWSVVPWSDRIYSVGPLAKLLAIPLLIYHFQRSPRGSWVLAGFFLSCTALMAFSWLTAFEPSLALRADASYGVPVKNYIDQSQEFTLCIVGILYTVARSFRQREFAKAVILIVVAACFLANMVFLNVSRTAMVTMPIMFFIVGFRYLTPRSMMVALGIVVAIAAAAWFGSPSLRIRADSIVTQYQAYENTNDGTSVGLRLEFWRKSLQFYAAAPILGHGTGSVRSLFTAAAAGQSGASAEIIANPHNQTLYNAIQWGAVGIAILFAVWLSHLLLFRDKGFADWIGLLVVVQNILTSVFNSHLFDFHEGWMYVLGVGVAGGMVLSTRTAVLAGERQEEGLV